MSLQNSTRDLIIGLAVILLIISGYALSGKLEAKETVPEGVHLLWGAAPSDVSRLDLYWGPGGEAMKPDLSRVVFVKDETGGSHSTKYRVQDGSGREWVVKASDEAQAETVAERLMWAAGYYTEVSHFVPRVEIEGKGTVERVRFEARPEAVKRLSEWSWDSNPFIGSVEFQGLKVMMLLLNNWDIKDENTKILLVRNPRAGLNELRYIISDLGGTLGRTGSLFTRSRNFPADFARSAFIKNVSDGRVFFEYHGKHPDLFRDITVEHALWIGERLSRLSDQQISDAVRAADYTPEEARLLTQALRARIDQLSAVGEVD